MASTSKSDELHPEGVIRSRLELPTVTLCAATSVNLDATLAALRACLDQVEFAHCLLLTDATLANDDPRISIISIARLNSSRDYSEFMLKHLADHIQTEHCLVVQWDGFVLDASRWESSFLSWDYIGAPWPQFHDDHTVGNGGFSLRSRKLLEACRDPAILPGHPEDIAICRTNRQRLERLFGIRFANREDAARFAFERGGDGRATFGFHGVFNMLQVMVPERFWTLYATLDDRSTAFLDYRILMGQIGQEGKKWSRRLGFTLDWLEHLFRPDRLRR